MTYSFNSPLILAITPLKGATKIVRFKCVSATFKLACVTEILSLATWHSATRTCASDLDALLVGYSADADIILQTHKNVLRISSEALLDDLHVLTFNPVSHLLEKKAVKKGLSNWSYTEVLEGVVVGDKLVTSLGIEGVEEGVLAEIKNDQDNPND